MTDASGATGDSVSAEAVAGARKFGIRAKLFVAFVTFAGLTVAASAIAWIVFASIERSVSRVTERSVPDMADALALARNVAELSAAAPGLVVSGNHDELAGAKQALEPSLARFMQASAAIEEGDKDAAARVSELAAKFVENLDALTAHVGRRLDLKGRREAISEEAHAAHERFNETLEPLVDDAVFDLVISGEDVMANNTAAITTLVDEGVNRVDRLLNVNAAVNLAAGLLSEAATVDDPARREPIRERFVSASLAIERNLTQLPDDRRVATLRRSVDQLLALGRGRDNPFAGDRLTAASTTVAGAPTLGQRLNERHEKVLLLLTPMIDDAVFDLVMNTEETAARSETAISGLIDGNAGILNSVLEARASGNLAASLLSDAGAVTDESRLVPLFDGFVAAEARLVGLLAQVEGAAFHEDLSDVTMELLRHGHGQAGVFSLRRTELEEAAAGQAALDASRTLSLELGAQVSEIVNAAEAESRSALQASADATDIGQIVLVVITLVGLAGAAIIMFRYVDPRVIRPVGRITATMTELAGGNTSVDIPGRDRADEIGDMARALGVFRDNAVAVQEANLKEIQTTRRRLAEAIESISEGFSLYDADERLVVCNNRYRQLLYPDMPDVVVPGVTFESILRHAVAKGLIKNAEDDPEGWIAERLARRRDPAQPHIQERSNGLFIMVSEHKTEDGGTVAVYSDITELKQRESELARKSGELEQLAGQLAKYLSPQVYDSIFSGRQEVKVASRRKKLTVFFSDIVGFTATSEKLEPEDLTDLLNEHLTEMAKIALRHGATIDKYVGDAIMIFFGDPESRGVQQDALSCVEMAIEMREKMDELRSRWRDSGIENPVHIRIGINTGFCTVGNFGSEARMDYTIIGANVNLASRLESAAEPGGILIAYETYALVKDRILCEPQEAIRVKGVAEPVAAYKVIDRRTRLSQKSGVLREDRDNLRLEMNPAAMSQDERREAEAALRQALDRLSSASDV